MPDLMSHVLIALIIGELFNVRKKSLIVMGAIAPDVLSKLDLLYFHFGIPKVITFSSFHTPFMCFLLSLFISAFFVYPKLKTVILFNIGAISEFSSDFFVKHFSTAGQRIFYPLSLHNYAYGLFWSDDSLYILIGLLLIYASIKFIKRNSKKEIKYRKKQKARKTK